MRMVPNPFNDTLGLVHEVLKARTSKKYHKTGHPPCQTMGRPRKPLLSSVHVATASSKCVLMTCGKTFQPRQGEGGSQQRFCCPDHRREFFRLARRVRAALLTQAVSDPKLEAVVKSLLIDEKKGVSHV